MVFPKNVDVKICISPRLMSIEMLVYKNGMAISIYIYKTKKYVQYGPKTND